MAAPSCAEIDRADQSSSRELATHRSEKVISAWILSCYRTATVTVRVVLIPSMETLIGTSPDGVTPFGMVALICNTPVGRNGAAPAYWMLAFSPAKATVTVPGLGYGVEMTSAPSGSAGVVTPSPVPNMTTTEPRAAGLAWLLSEPS